MSRGRIVTFDDAEVVAREAAWRFLELANNAARDRGRFIVALAGGSTPRRMYGLLASGPLRPMLPWSRTHVLFGDERAVPPSHEDSNERMVRETLLNHVRMPAENVLRVEAERGAVEAADRYERALRGLFGEDAKPRADLVLLGVGEDGHTASLFPNSPALLETRRWVATATAPDGVERITLTLPFLNAARHVLFVVTGERKARIVAEAFGGRAHAWSHPCERVCPEDGTLEIYCDRAAAASAG